jgi:hypothetical protein
MIPGWKLVFTVTGSVTANTAINQAEQEYAFNKLQKVRNADTGLLKFTKNSWPVGMFC